MALFISNQDVQRLITVAECVPVLDDLFRQEARGLVENLPRRRIRFEQGGTTLRDFVNESGSPGYFKQTLNVYDRAGAPCRVCGQPIQVSRLGQRSTYWCARCQR